MASAATVTWRAIGPDRASEFVARGHRERRFFPHRAHFLPRPGPDGFLLAERMCGVSDPAAMWLVVLYADPSLLTGLPSELFFDPEILWHEQHFGLPGQVAAADVVVADQTVWTMAHQSDLVQRIGRRRELKTRIEKRFQGWHDMLMNAILAFALEQGARRLCVPTATLAMTHTDRARTVGPELFERLYDRDVNRLYHAVRDGDWWALDVAANRDRLVEPVTTLVSRKRERTVCVCHDIEAGLGHVGIDDPLARRADRDWRANLTEMLRIEDALGVRATYNVVGRLLPEVRAEIDAGKHGLGFHSYDHPVEPARRRRRLLLPRPRREPTADESPVDQLAECRRIDYRIKGYRPPQSRITDELTDERLLRRNFEWLASGASSLGTRAPELRGGLVRIPIAADDFPLHTGESDYADWQDSLAERAASADTMVFSLHDCYGHLWLDRYAELLEGFATLGRFLTLDELAGEVTLAAGA